MKVWTLILLVVISSLAVNSQTCPSEHFATVFTATVDQIVDDPTSLIVDDSELSFFKTYMKFRDSDIQHTTDDAIQFLNNTYGLDFSDSPPNEKNERFFQNAKMSPFFFSPDKYDFIVTDSRWVQTGNTYSSCYSIREGGLRVTFSGDQILYGSYGGAEGKPAGSILYGFFIIDVCKQSPLIIQYQDSRPFRTEPIDGISIFTSDLYNQVLGYGNLYGIFQVFPVPDGFRIITRAVFTF